MLLCVILIELKEISSTGTEEGIARIPTNSGNCLSPFPINWGPKFRLMRLREPSPVWWSKTDTCFPKFVRF
ncbi:unnamed protein product [Victoria cruziana]